MEAAYGLVVRVTVAPGQQDAFDQLAAEAADAATTARPSPLVYACHTAGEEPPVRLIYQLHRDRSAYEDHERQPYARRFRRAWAALATTTEETPLSLTAGVAPGLATATGDGTASPAPGRPPAGPDPELDGTSFGQRIAVFRRRRGMSQRTLAHAVGRSESWMSQVERDILPVGRLSVLQRLADALGVSIYDLEPAELALPPPGQGKAAPAPAQDLDGVRAVLAGHPALAALLPRPVRSGGEATGTGTEDDDRPAVDVAALERAVDDSWALVHDARMAEAGRRLGRTLPAIEEALRRPRPGEHAVPEDRRRALLAARARAYEAAATAFAQAEEPDAAWVAAERALATAEAADDVWGVVAALYRMAHGFARHGRLAEAEHVVGSTLAALSPLVEAGDAPAEARSLAGALRLVGGVTAARAGRRSAAHDHVEAARALASGLGGYRDERDTEFGPTNVDVHAVAVAVELGDAGVALDMAQRVDPSPLSAERQARFLVDVARAHGQRRQLAAATRALLDAEAIAPELVAADESVRDAVRLLVQQAGEEATDDLRALAHRTAAGTP
jgi:transcriptional regulator with XRE-family HTH domain/quinol monooxygenase YgiN